MTGTANSRTIADVALRRGTPEDAKECGRIIYEAFKSIADQHNFPTDFPVERALQGPGFLVPTRNGELMRWCLDQGLRIATQATLMTVGLYNEPMGRYLPSILY